MATLWERLSAALSPIDGGAPEISGDELKLACGALLLEMCRADFDVHPNELRQIAAELRERFALNEDDAQLLIERAEATTDVSVSIAVYTSLLNERLGHEAKLELLKQIWHVALADGRIHVLERRLFDEVAAALGVSRRSVEQLIG